MSVCASCLHPQGPFSSIMDGWGLKVCMNTKEKPKRISECVERREKRMAKLYNTAPNLIG